MRYQFETDKKYAGKLINAFEKPIVNCPALRFYLIRLEFEIFKQEVAEKKLVSTGCVACRDMVVTPELVGSNKDGGLTAYLNALRISIPDLKESPATWFQTDGEPRWIEIEFGKPSVSDGRNPFKNIRKFDPTDWTKVYFPIDRCHNWGTVQDAVKVLRAGGIKVSESTVRRRVKELEPQYGSDLVRRTDGRHRRINIHLLCALWGDIPDPTASWAYKNSMRLAQKKAAM